MTQSFRILACQTMSHGDEILRERSIFKISFETATGFVLVLEVSFPGYFSCSLPGDLIENEFC